MPKEILELSTTLSKEFHKSILDYTLKYQTNIKHWRITNSTKSNKSSASRGKIILYLALNYCYIFLDFSIFLAKIFNLQIFFAMNFILF